MRYNRHALNKQPLAGIFSGGHVKTAWLRTPHRMSLIDETIWAFRADPLDYRVSQSFAGEVRPKQLRAMNVQVVIYSDAYPFLVLRDPALSSTKAITREKAIRDILETEWIKLATFKRMPWLGEDISPDDVSYWHQMGITIYCNPTNCPVDGR